MRPTTETLTNPSNLQRLGSGLFAIAYLQADGTVLKISRAEDGTMDYIEWCWLRMKKFGKGSVEMAGLPEVEHFGRTKEGSWAVMPCYVSADAHLKGDCTDRRTWTYRFADAIVGTVALIEKALGVYVNDIHAGNVMWDPKRRMWVVTDPISCDATGVGSTAPQLKRFKTVAAWKRSPLQALHRA